MSAAATRLNLSRTKILAVDDSQQAMDILSQILLGFCVEKTIKCSSVDEATNVLTVEKVNLVIVDDRLAEKDGFNLIAWIRSNPKAVNYTTPIMLATGNPTLATVYRARDAGANCLLAKPLTPGVLLKRMQYVAHHNRDFITSDTYRGPDRRVRAQPLPEGIQERRADALRLLETPERALSQDEINSMFA